MQSSNVPWGWTNEPAYLRAPIYFSDAPDRFKKSLKDEHKIPYGQPILNDRGALPLLDGGDRKYHLWNDISGYVARIDVSDLKTILTAMREHGDGSLKYTILDN